VDLLTANGDICLRKQQLGGALPRLAQVPMNEQRQHVVPRLRDGPQKATIFGRKGSDQFLGEVRRTQHQPEDRVVVAIPPHGLASLLLGELARERRHKSVDAELFNGNTAAGLL
jgi:hypothetical protein